MKRKFMALALAAAMTVSMTSAVFAADEIKSADDLEGKKIGVQLGTTGDTLATDIKDATVERYNKGNDAVLALKQGKVDCVVIDSEPAKKFVEKNDDLDIIEDVFDKEEYAICLSKDNADLTKEFNEALKELKDEGTLDSIRDNYIGDDAGKTPYESPKDADHSKGTLTMATNATFQPYEYYDGDNIVGIDADIAQAVCDKLGYELKIEDMEFDSIITAVQTGKADIGFAGMTVTEERIEAMFLSKPYLDNRQVVIVEEGSKIASVSDLAGKTVGLQKGSSAREAFDANPIASEVAQVVEYEDNVDAFLDLQAGRIDALLVDEVAGNYIIETYSKNQ